MHCFSIFIIISLFLFSSICLLSSQAKDISDAFLSLIVSSSEAYTSGGHFFVFFPHVLFCIQVFMNCDLFPSHN